MMITLRDRAQKILAAEDDFPVPARPESGDASGDEEESAI
jgi:hypothetical protein